MTMSEMIGAKVHYQTNLRIADMYGTGVILSLGKATVTIRDCATGETVKRPDRVVFLACQSRYMPHN